MMATSTNQNSRAGESLPGGIAAGRCSAWIRGFLALIILCFASTAAFGQVKITLAWNPSISPNIAGYNVYYGQASGSYTTVIKVGNTNLASITNLTVGTTYYFVATAMDTSGIESVFSNELSYTAVAPAIRLNLAFSPLKQPLLTGTSLAGLQFDVLASGDLTNWVAIGQTRADAAGSFSYTEASPPDGAGQRFYQVRQLP